MHLTDRSEVVFDARWLRTGIGRYILTLLGELKPRLSGAALTCITMPAYAKTIAPYCDRVVKLPCDIYTVREQLSLPFIARGASIFCSPHYNVPLLRRGPVVATVHDLTHLVFGAYRTRATSRLYAEPMLRMTCSKASRIITPSYYTRMMLVSHLHVDPARISVIPCAVSSAFQPQDKETAAEKVRLSHGVSVPYILCVSSAAPHKNLARLLMVHQRLCSENRDTPTLVLVLPKAVTASGMDEHMRSLVTRPRVRCLTSVPDAALASLYSAAIMTVLPSLEEGFGLPVVESMACGTPVACSDAASLPEVGGDAALYFSPDSASEMSSAILRLLHSGELRQRLAVKGLERAALYSASSAAQAYASMLTSVLAEQN
jgi:glycosyltransferase involved in cell wall biosynthesis